MIWRALNSADCETIFIIGNQIHADYQEDRAVFESRFALYPEGCLGLEDNGTLRGYAISHPWKLFDPPKLDTVLHTLPARPDTYYLHDLALLPEARGGGHAAQAIGFLARHAASQGYDNSTLVAVGGTTPFWERQGYRIQNDPVLSARLATYDENAAYMLRPLQTEP